MAYSAIICSVVLGIATIYQLIQVIIYAWNIRSPVSDILDNDYLPKFAVLMPLRGADPFLAHAINSVLDQDYPDFQLHFVIDHPTDPSLKVVEETISQRDAKNVQISFINPKRDTCSLLCNAVQQFAAELDDEVELFLVCAADVVLPRNWLKVAATAMQDPTVGATLGNRWYMPRIGRLGSLVRYIWNTAANISMFRHQGAWSGAMALRVRDLRRLDFSKVWLRSFTEDMSVAKLLTEAGLKLEHVPHLIAVNREEITVRGNFNFIQRQFFIARFHHPNGLRMICDSLPLSLASLLCLVLFIIAVFIDNIPAALYTAGMLATSIFLLGLSVLMTEFLVRRIMKARREETTSVSLFSFLLFPLALLICQFQYLLAIPAALLTRRIVWRGVAYDVNIRRKEIRMLDYEPYSPPAILEEHPVSI